MPNPNDFDNQADFMKVCVPMRVKEGDKQEQAVAACLGMWRNKGKSLTRADVVASLSNAIKQDSEELIAFGAELKDLGGGKVGGLLVRYTTKVDPDLTMDYFDAATEIHTPETLDVLYNHGQDATLKRQVLGKATTKREDAGLWVEAQLNLRDEYEKAIYRMAQQGKLSWSSGALSHLVEREPAGKAMHIKSWWIGEASLTPSPAEFRNSVTTLKALTSDQAALTDADAQTAVNHKETSIMDAEEIKAATEKAVADALAQRDAIQKAESEKQAALTAAEEAGYKKAMDDIIKNRKAPAFNVIPNGTPEENNGGVTAFKTWVRTGQENSELIRPDGWDTKAAFNITTGGSGGFLVPDILYSQIIAKRQLASWVRIAPVQHFQTPADHLLVPVESTSATAFTRTIEADSYTENEPTVNQVDLVLYKYTKLIKMSEEFVNFQQTNFDAWLVGALARAEAVTENTIYTTGTGGGEPQGINASGAATAGNTVTTTLVLVPGDLVSLVGQLGAGYNTGSAECGYLMANATKWYAKGLSSSNYFAYIPTPVRSPNAGGPQTSGTFGDEGFNGYPAYISDDMPSYASATNRAVIFGNWNFFGVVEKPGMMVQRNPYLYMANGQIGLFASIYRGGGVLQKEAFYYLVAK
jgi:HK97 family phage major capsid protein